MSKESWLFEKLVAFLCKMENTKQKLTSLTFAGIWSRTAYLDISRLVRHCENLKEITMEGFEEGECDFADDLAPALRDAKKLEKVAFISMMFSAKFFNDICRHLYHCERLTHVSFVANNIGNMADLKMKKLLLTLRHHSDFTLTCCFSDFCRVDRAKEYFSCMEANPKLREIRYIESDHDYQGDSVTIEYKIPSNFSLTYEKPFYYLKRKEEEKNDEKKPMYDDDPDCDKWMGNFDDDDDEDKSVKRRKTNNEDEDDSKNDNNNA